MQRILTLFVALATACVVMAAECVIVPQPVSFEPQKGKVTLNSKSVVYVADKSLVRPATMFCSYIAAEKGLQLSVVESQPKGKGAISLKGKMIDAPIVARAEQTIKMAQALGIDRGVL